MTNLPRRIGTSMYCGYRPTIIHFQSFIT